MATKPERPEVNLNEPILRETQVKKDKVPSKGLMLAVVITYTISNAVFLVSILLNLPMLRDTLDFGTDKMSLVIQVMTDYYIVGSISASFVIIIGTLIMYCSYVKYGFPSILSLVAMVYNDLICIGFMILIYILDVRNIYFSLQAVFAIPIITIFLSSVFVIVDFDDYRRGNFLFPSEDLTKKKKKEKRRKGELQSTVLPDEMDENFFTPAIEASKVIAKAAKMAIPALNPEKTNKDTNSSNNESSK